MFYEPWLTSTPHFPTLNETLRFFHYFVCGIKNVAEICVWLNQVWMNSAPKPAPIHKRLFKKQSIECFLNFFMAQN